MLRRLCEQLTDLADADIAILEDYAAKLEAFAEISDSVMYIDALTRDRKDAVVLCEQYPSQQKNSAGEPGVGKIINKVTEPGVMRTLLTGLVSKKVKGISLENLPIYQTAVPLRNAKNVTIGALIREEEILEEHIGKRHVEDLIDEAKVLAEQVDVLHGNLWLFTRHISDAILVFDNNEKAVHINYEATELYRKLGFMEDIVGMSFRNLVLDGEVYETVHTHRSDVKKELELADMFLEVQCICMPQDNDACIVMLIRDLSEIRAKDRELVLSTVILQEVYHRIKNNLQTVASILRMQARMSEHEAVKKALSDNVNRVLSIAATHDLLVKRGNDTLGIKELLTRLASSILSHGSGEGCEITISVEGDEVVVTSDVATSVALIVNELVSNSFKHAFGGRDCGHIRIVIERSETRPSLAVIDDGQGMPEEVPVSGKLGLNIVESLVRDKLESDLVFLASGAGTHVQFSFSGV